MPYSLGLKNGPLPASTTPVGPNGGPLNPAPQAEASPNVISNAAPSVAGVVTPPVSPVTNSPVYGGTTPNAATLELLRGANQYNYNY